MLRDALGAALIGVYLHGSAASGDFDAARSDVDILAVCAAPLSAEERDRIAGGLDRAALPCPAARGLELSLITAAAARDAGPAPAYELHGWDSGGHLHPAGDGGDPDLPRHYALVRTDGVVIAGPPPADVFRDVPRAELLALAAGELDWAAANASPSTAVLTACRAWALSVDGRFRSKGDAAEWALRQGAPPIVADVLGGHRAAGESHPDPAAVAAFTASVRTRLQHK